LLFIKEDKESQSCYYQAHVWFKNHSLQCGCFSNIKAAEKWANWLHKRITTDDLLKISKKQGA